MTGDDDEVLRLGAVARTGLDNAPDETMDRLAGLVTRLLGSPIGLVSLVDDRRQFFPGQVGLDAPWSDIRETPLSQSLCAMVVETRDIVQIDDAAIDERTAEHGARTVLGVGSYLGAPLLDSDGRVLGSLCALGPTTRLWTAQERQILADLAFGASSELRARIAVTDANVARADAELARQRVELMADVSTALNSTMDPELSVRRMLAAVVDRLALWSMVFIRADDESPQRMFARHRSEDVNDELSDLISDTALRLSEMNLTRGVMDGSTRFVLISGDDAQVALARSGTSEPIIRRLGLGSVIVVPMPRGPEIVGALVLVRGLDQPDFDEVDLILAGDLARRAAMAIDHARIYAREKRVASQLQHSLLPHLPVVERLEVGAVYAAASKGVEVGGDWYDLVELDDGSFIATIGDVTGHSIGAAAAMGRLQSVVRTVATQGRSPAEILGHVAAAAPGMLGDLLATCLIIRLEPDDDGSWTISTSNAGHLPPLVIAPNGDVTFVEVMVDPLLGLSAVGLPARRQTTATLAGGTTVVLYTDGLVERRREDIDVGLHRLVAAVPVAFDAGEPTSQFVAGLLDAVKPAGDDDIAVIALRLR
jgi:GAF domain-containing protein